MQQINNNNKTIREPRPVWNLKFQFVTVATFVMLGISFLTSNYVSGLDTKLHVIAFLSVLLLIAEGILFFAPRKDSVIVSANNSISIYKEDNLIAEYSLRDIREIISKNTWQNTGPQKYELAIEKLGGDYHVLFKPASFYSRTQWELFAVQLSQAADKPLKKEYWAENYHGNLVLLPATSGIVNKKKMKTTLLIPLTISFVGALCFKLVPTSKTFIIAGIGTILVNLSVFLLLARKEQQKEKALKNNLVTITGIFFSMIVPYATQYLFFVFALMGFDISKLARLFD